MLRYLQVLLIIVAVSVICTMLNVVFFKYFKLCSYLVLTYLI